MDTHFVRGLIERRKQRMPLRKKIWRFIDRSEFFLGLSAFLIILAVVGVVLIYGPVVKAEFQYQVRTLANGRSGWGLLVPDFRLGVKAMPSDYVITIPKLFIRTPVVANVNPTVKAEYQKALRKGIAHAAGTGLPGDPGLGYYFAHSSGYSVLSQGNAVFYLLGKLEHGDEVQLYRNGVEYTYQVYDKRVTAADDVSFLYEYSEDERIVLQTCWPIGTSLKRLLVFAKRV